MRGQEETSPFQSTRFFLNNQGRRVKIILQKETTTVTRTFDKVEYRSNASIEKMFEGSLTQGGGAMTLICVQCVFPHG